MGQNALGFYGPVLPSHLPTLLNTRKDDASVCDTLRKMVLFVLVGLQTVLVDVGESKYTRVV